MLEVLDPEQNNTFVDHYLDVEYSLADVLFICTANSVQNITGPLLDRMEVIHLSGYTELEKLHIATQFLTPRQRKFHGLDEKQLARASWERSLQIKPDHNESRGWLILSSQGS